MTPKTKAAIEEAAEKFGHTRYVRHRCRDKKVYVLGLKEVIEHPERYGLVSRKPIGTQETRELVNQMLAEEISFSRFVELINEGGKK